ncbi:hypothetical protein PLICRDRAFT_282033 [Plicaturopsis crispa FD-325 SS-3]|nr:hypothetical protein PLICRDRAFT_282033 [Plicaturopsis crispa FD-325 SS-3]
MAHPFGPRIGEISDFDTQARYAATKIPVHDAAKLQPDGPLSSDHPYGTLSSANSLELAGTIVVLRVKVSSEDSSDDMIQRLIKAFDQAGQLKHRNIFCLLGLVPSGGLLPFLFYSRHGINIKDHLLSHPQAKVIPLVADVTRGLAYMHSQAPPVIHGDLRTTYVFLSEDGAHASISFAALSSALSTTYPWSRYSSLEAAAHEGSFTPTPESDVFSFAMVAYELFSGNIPYPKFHDLAVLAKCIVPGRIPRRPSHPELTDEIWALFLQCWNKDPSARPTMATVNSFFQSIVGDARPSL